MLQKIVGAINQLCDEKNLSKEIVLQAIESALAAAYRKDYGSKEQNIKVKFNIETQEMKVWDERLVTEEISEDIPEREQITPDEAKKLGAKDAKLGSTVKIPLPAPKDFGRVAAQTAKQVIIQKIREAERDNIFAIYKAKEGQVISGMLQRMERGNVYVDLGDASGIIPPDEQIQRERYRIGDRIKCFLAEVRDDKRGAFIILSRSHPKLVSGLFHTEVPEISAGTVVIKSIARDPGSRTKIAVQSLESDVDPIGACVGQKGTRVQAIISELANEKIDIIQYDENPEKYISNSLGPAKVDRVDADIEKREANIQISEDQLSLAIGLGGQNVKLASKLTGYKLNILKDQEEIAATEEPVKDTLEPPKPDQEDITDEQQKEPKKESKEKDSKKEKKDEKKEEKSKQTKKKKENKIE